jgi:ribosomal protein L11 methyltransferase
VGLSSKRWHAIKVKTSQAAREAIEYGLMEAGALGNVSIDLPGGVEITGYYEQPIDEETVRGSLAEALRIYDLALTEISELKILEVADADWLAEWKKHWQPVEAGRFIIAPPWIEPVSGRDAGGSIIVRINPGMAFGTGTHETTRLCLKAIEKHFRGGSFLDVGTGTGILAIAAAKMFTESRIEARDVDAEAIEIAKENARLNQVQDRIEFCVGSIDEQTSSADLVCANLTAPVIVELLPVLLSAACGRMVLSGILDSQVEMVETRLSELAANVLEMDREGEWTCLVV